MARDYWTEYYKLRRAILYEDTSRDWKTLRWLRDQAEKKDRQNYLNWYALVGAP